MKGSHERSDVVSLTLVLLNPDISCVSNSVHPDQLASDLDLHCLPSSIQIYNNDLDQVT